MRWMPRVVDIVSRIYGLSRGDRRGVAPCVCMLGILSGILFLVLHCCVRGRSKRVCEFVGSVVVVIGGGGCGSLC